MAENKPLSAAERKAAERKRKQAKGLVRLEIWVHESNKEAVKQIEKQLQKPK